MARYDQRWLKIFTLGAAVVAIACLLAVAEAGRSHANLTACQHLRRFENRRSKALGTRVRVPRCDKQGRFEEIQCTNAKKGEDCWCVDEYGVEIPGTRSASKKDVYCKEPDNCPASACRMFCPSGFARDPYSGCTQCRCRDPCENVTCPNGQSCQLMEVKCKTEPCPPVPTCKKARSLGNFCPAGMPLAIEDGTSMRPFLCGSDVGKPQCPPLYQCMVEGGNDYGVCCPSALRFNKPGVCPAPETENYTERTGHMCGTPCTHDLECSGTSKCCYTIGCQYSCQQPHNVTSCQQARAMSDLLSISDREGRGYIPDCTGPNGVFSPRQCSRNGLVCWCVDPRTGHKIVGSMGAANAVNCDGWENMIDRSVMGRSFQENKCDTSICANVCEYGFKNDHNNCPTCECSQPCEGFQCPLGSECDVATDPMCKSGSSLCASWPVCKPLLAYSNPCDYGTPLTDNATSELLYCDSEERSVSGREIKSFFDSEINEKSSRSLTNTLVCPADFKCTKQHGDFLSVCCPMDPNPNQPEGERRQQTMCEYLRDFSERMEGTEEGMKLALPTPRCTKEGHYEHRQCSYRKIKVTRAEQRKILEENTIRRMRMLLAGTASKRSKRNTERLKLYRVDDSLLKVQVAAPIMGRSAKVIDMGSNKDQSLGQLFETDFKKIVPAPKLPVNEDELIELDVEECWCVDSFGTEIPKSRGFNVTDESCAKMREDIDCLDLTCRMGCEYGFTLDPETRCPACQCRDPCQDVVCGENEECRIVEVSCDDEYCPPVPACLARKPGQCPYLVPPGPDNLDTNACAYECRTDSHCDGPKRCCSNGCGTQCVMPQMKTACQHLQAIQMHQSSELGIPVMKMNISQCDFETGEWKQIQCAPNGYCWCVNEQGQEISGTRTKGSEPICVENSAFQCPKLSCPSENCESGFKVDANGCQTCECRDFCDEIHCSPSEDCQLISVECVNSPCPKMPICVPRRESVCPEGKPLSQGETEVSCGPHNENETCPSTHTCQINPVSNRGVCCTKTRDVCFESMDNLCLAKEEASGANATRYRFNPKANRCVVVTIDLGGSSCQTKNLFNSESSCNSVCPALTQCERLKMKNTLAAQRTGHSSVWFKPRCDPVTGHWSPVQCLGKQPNLKSLNEPSEQAAPSPYGVCWCADKKGAPLKGTLTRDNEPVCNSRQGRRLKKQQNTPDLLVVEELIRQMTALTDIDNYLPEDDEIQNEFANIEARQKMNEEMLSVQSIFNATEKIKSKPTVIKHDTELANSLMDSQLVVEYVKPIKVKTTRCRTLAKTAPFPVNCEENGAFSPMQCNKKHCWCVDAAGNQLETSPMFERGQHECTLTPISAVTIEMHLQNSSATSLHNVYDVIRNELDQLLGRNAENLRVQEYSDGSAVVRFELHDEDKIDMAFAIETTVTSGDFKLAGGHYTTDVTRVQFIHRREELPVYAKVVITHEGTIQLVLFITASSTALLICIFVVYIMLKRGKEKAGFYENHTPPPYQSRKTSLNNDSDFASPIFVLSPEHDLESIRPPLEYKLQQEQKQQQKHQEKF